jgi:hypothetical protein
MLETKLKGLTSQELDQLAINTIRTLSIDAVQQAKSGHPGTPMALAPLVYTIWNRVMRFDPQDPIWPNRDRFVLSNGHASMLLWSVLYLTGTQAVNAEYELVGKPAVTLDDIRHFRRLDSKAPGHPEYHWTSGVETTTGPLGQGIATISQISQPRSTRCSAASSRPDGIATCRSLRPTPRALRAATRRARRSMRLRRTYRGSSAALRIWPPRPGRR